MKPTHSFRNLVAVMMAAGLLSQGVSFAAPVVSVKSSQAQAIPAKKIVTLYLLIDTPEQLKRYTDDLKKIEKANFNRVIFSFVKPTMPDYQTGNLAYTGILGYFGKGDGKGVAAFEQLKAAVALSQQKNIQAFLSVGGWNYSCNKDKFHCGPADLQYDWFPDPTDAAQKQVAEKSYANLVKLANDLGVNGIDFDYEEFWHADDAAVAWLPASSGEWSTDIAKNIINAGGPTYDNLMKHGTGSHASGSASVMPKTVSKVNAILHAIADHPDAKNLEFATAAPPVGARPVTGFVYGDNYPDIYEKGGVWWGGNLKGLWYNLNDQDAAIVDRFDSLGLMTYDLCGDNAYVCAPYGGAALDLPSQVAAYMKDYTTWLKAPVTRVAQMSVDNIGKVKFLPAKFNIKSKIQFGFEVSRPAYPTNPAGILQLTDKLVDTILQQQKDSDGVIIWEMYSQQNKEMNGTTAKYTVQQSCKTFLAGDDRYNCNADFPSAGISAK